MAFAWVFLAGGQGRGLALRILVALHAVAVLSVLDKPVRH